jgi:hypothetical protein
LLMTHLEYKKDYILMIFDESYFVTWNSEMSG